MAEQSTPQNSEPAAKGTLATIGDFLARKGRRAWTLKVVEKSAIGPRMMRVTFRGDDVDELEWRRGQDLVLEIPSGPDIARRHYTIRHHEGKTLVIDFVLHGESPANDWVRNATPGSTLVAAGPRGRTVLNESADWHLFVGDTTCIPAIFAMLEGLPATAKAFAFIEAEPDDTIAFAGTATPQIEWIGRGAAPGGRILFEAVDGFALPPGNGHAYVIGETSTVRAIRQRLLARGFSKDRIAAEGYWRPGRIGGHDHA
ncbi:MAG TPA: siderophore-interacting protein [Rhizomicrobium sp.]|jgi:NADPH-dependent ferric siderophore reductase